MECIPSKKLDCTQTAIRGGHGSTGLPDAGSGVGRAKVIGSLSLAHVKSADRLFGIRTMQWARMIAICRRGVTGSVGVCMSDSFWSRGGRITRVIPNGSQGRSTEMEWLLVMASANRI